LPFSPITNSVVSLTQPLIRGRRREVAVEHIRRHWVRFIA